MKWWMTVYGSPVGLKLATTVLGPSIATVQLALPSQSPNQRRNWLPVSAVAARLTVLPTGNHPRHEVLHDRPAGNETIVPAPGPGFVTVSRYDPAVGSTLASAAEAPHGPPPVTANT
jgi:hypothetical protein